MSISYERASRLFKYDEETGVLSRAANGRAIGYPQNGYLATKIERKTIYVHRLIWLLKTGSFPDFHIDHVDSDRLNNRFSNLRQASRSENLRNTGAYKNNKTGFKGVSKHGNRYRAQISVSGRTKYLGSYLSPSAANAAYFQAASRLSPDFARGA